MAQSLSLDDALLDRLPALRQALENWTSADIGGAAHRALTYLPDGVVVQARVHLVIKPKTNSYVFELEDDPAIFLYLDPDFSAAKLENTVAHELRPRLRSPVPQRARSMSPVKHTNTTLTAAVRAAAPAFI